MTGFYLGDEERARGAAVGDVQVVPRPCAGDEQQAPLALQILRVSERIRRRHGSPLAGAGTTPSATPITATAWNSRPFHAMHGADADRVFRRLGGERDGRDPRRPSARRQPASASQLARAAMPIACGSMPSSTPAANSLGRVLLVSASRDRAAMRLGAAPVQGRVVAGERVGLVVQAGDRRLAERGDG